MNRKVRQLICRAALPIRAVARFGLLILLCGPLLLLAGGGAEVVVDARLVSKGDAALVTVLREQTRPLQHAEGDRSDDQDEPPPGPGGTSAVRPAGASLSLLVLFDGHERLPDPPEFLLARLRAPPVA